MQTGPLAKPLLFKADCPSLLPENRAFISQDFRLFLGSKSKQKICEIGNETDSQSQLVLHARQSLAERLIFSGKNKLQDIESKRKWPNCTYLIANFGLIMTDKPHQKQGEHRRSFLSIPIKVPGVTITGSKHPVNGHAEEAFYEYLLQDDNIVYYLNEIKKQFGPNAQHHKIYGVVLDLHGTYDMCQSCSEKGANFQNAFREKCLAHFKTQGMLTLSKYPHQLPIIIRYSSDLKYDYPAASDTKKKGMLALVSRKSAERDLKPSSDDSAYDLHRDIKQFDANLLLHGKTNWHGLWSISKRAAHEGKPLRLESWSAFVSDGQYRSLSEEAKQRHYTDSGYVDTSEEALPDISKLSLKP